MLHQSAVNDRFRSIKSLKDKPKCPINSSHSITTNLFGEWVCESCADNIDDLKKHMKTEKE